MNFIVREKTNMDYDWIRPFMEESWGADFIVSRNKVYYSDQLPGFVAERDGKPVGLCLYHTEDR